MWKKIISLKLVSLNNRFLHNKHSKTAILNRFTNSPPALNTTRSQAGSALSGKNVPTIHLLLGEAWFHVQLATRAKILRITIVHVSRAVNRRIATRRRCRLHAATILWLPDWLHVGTAIMLLLATTYTQANKNRSYFTAVPLAVFCVHISELQNINS